MNFTVELVVPAIADMILIVRMTASGVMSRAGMTLDALDDFKMVAEESCHCLMAQKIRYGALRLVFSVTSDRVTLTVSGVDGVDDPTAHSEPHALEVVRAVLESMADQAILTGKEGRLTAITTVKMRSDT